MTLPHASRSLNHGSVVLIVAAIVSTLGLFAGGCSTMPPNTGPMVGVQNDTDTPLRVRFWVGARREQASGKSLEMTGQDQLEIPPYGVKQYKLSAFSGYDSPADSFVRVQVEPIGPSFQPQTQYWFELNPPSPFGLHVFGQKPGLRFERMGPGTLTMVPPALWFHAGEKPAQNAAGTTPASASVAVQSPAPGASPKLTTTTTAVRPAPQPGAKGTTKGTTMVTAPEPHDIRE